MERSTCFIPGNAMTENIPETQNTALSTPEAFYGVKVPIMASKALPV